MSSLDKGSKVTSFLSFRSAIADFVECSNAKEYARARPLYISSSQLLISNKHARQINRTNHLSSVNHTSVLAIRKSVTHI